MTTIYLIRHAEAEGNLYRIAQGQIDSNLSQRGRQQAQALERRFSEVGIDAVYSSDLYRACATAGAICLPKQLPLHRMKELREIDVGVWENRTWGDIGRQDPEQLWNFNHAAERWEVSGAETPLQVQQRMVRALREIARENDGRTVAVFSHGCAIRMALAGFQNVPLDRVCSDTALGTNTAVSLLRGTGEDLRVIFRDDDSHLYTEEYLSQTGGRQHPNGVEKGLYFQLAEGEELGKTVRELWPQSGDGRTFDLQTLLAGTTGRKTLTGFLNGEVVGVIQLGPEPNWISLLCVRQAYQNRGLGIQMIGQAVYAARKACRDVVYVPLTPGASAEKVLEGHGFFTVGVTQDGRTVWEKSIAFQPEILAL